MSIKRFMLLACMATSCGSSSESELSIIGGQKAPNDKAAKGIFPATIGILTQTGNACTGTRIGKNSFITAAHCFKASGNDTTITLYASNSKQFIFLISSFKVHSTWAANANYKSDIALFDVSFSTVEQANDFDSLVEIAPLSTKVPSIGTAVKLAGFGCSQKTGLSSSECDVRTNFEYMKTANNKIIDDNAFLAPDNRRSFQLDGSSNKEGIDGFIEIGDSGGPVYTTNGELLGVNSTSNNGILTGSDGFLIWTQHAWIGYDDVKEWLLAVLSTEPKNPKYLPDGYKITYRYNNGTFYGGFVRNGMRNGLGTMEFTGGRVYNGNWVDDKRSGYGEQTWAAGAEYVSYKGNWENDTLHGEGTMLYSSGLIYSGQHANGKIHGLGKMTYTNGDVRTGNFVNSKREGEFIRVAKSGNMYREQFADDVRISSEKIN